MGEIGWIHPFNGKYLTSSHVGRDSQQRFKRNLTLLTHLTFHGAASQDQLRLFFFLPYQ